MSTLTNIPVKTITKVMRSKSYKNYEIIIIPEGVTEIGEEIFKGCYQLKQIILPQTLKHIRREAFAGCTNLRIVRIPNGVTYIGSKCFAGCTNLRGVYLGEGLEDLYWSAFQNCENLEYIYIPSKEFEIRCLYTESGNMYCCDGDPCTIHTLTNIKVASIPADAEYDMWLDDSKNIEKIFVRIDNDRYVSLDVSKYSDIKAANVEIVWMKGVQMFDAFLLGILRLFDEWDVLDGCSIAIEYVWPCFSFEDGFSRL